MDLYSIISSMGIRSECYICLLLCLLSRILLCRRGKITYYTQPPEQHTLPTHLSAQIVTSMAAEFDIDALTADESSDMKGSTAQC